MTPTPEQSAILDYTAGNGNLMIQAFAGCGKTATLEMIDAAAVGPHLLVCFNKSVAAEATKRVKSTTQVRTFNGLGHRIWSTAIGKKISLVKTKKIDIFKEMANEKTSKYEKTEMWKYWDQISMAVEMARAVGYIPAEHARTEKRLCGWKEVQLHLDELTGGLARTLVDELLLRSIRMAYSGIIDYSDQTYMPALFGGSYPQFPLVLVDEWQDLSPINLAIVDKLCRRSRVIGVGDEAQAIYAFRGATEDSIPSARVKFSMATLPLSVSFRCPTKIVENVRWRVPSFKAYEEGGLVGSAKSITDNSTIICRNNAPLFALAVKLLVEGRKVDVSGVDLAGRLATILGKLGPEETTTATLLDLIDSWEQGKVENDSKSAPDIAAAMRVFAKQARTLGGALATIRHVASQQGDIHFLTGHKAKGLEWDHVYHLDQHLLQEDGQDPNLRYVCDTRTKDRLTYIDSRELA